MGDLVPYRISDESYEPVRLVVLNSCHHCTWREWLPGPPHHCTHPQHGPEGAFCRGVNRHGDCEDFKPSLLTRLLRKLGLRKPVTVEEKTDED